MGVGGVKTHQSSELYANEGLYAEYAILRDGGGAGDNEMFRPLSIKL